MRPIKFNEANIVFAKDQPEYLPLPAYYNRLDPLGTVVSCWQMTWRERLRALWSGRVYISVLTFHHPLQPQHPSVEPPFTDSTTLAAGGEPQIV